MKHFINERETAVQESLLGLLASSGGRLTRLDGFPHVKVVMRADWDKEKVAIISGGGSGHEPAHAGFVGPGMLTAAVCGEIFASPSVEAVLAAIRAVGGKAGTLLVVKNYTGDRLNFGLAAERARQMGHRVEVVMVGDDVSLAPSIQPRGVAGTLFVHKVAGYHAERGDDLETVARIAAEVAGASKSLGLALTTCHPPGSSHKEHLPQGQAELGLGIHGEPGAEKVDMTTARELMALVVEGLTRYGADGPFCALINNLGAVPPLEMGILMKEYLESPLGGLTELLIGPAPMMTSYDMNGFSVSLLPLTEERRQALLAEVRLPAWPGAQPLSAVTAMALPESVRAEPAASQDPLVRAHLLALLSAWKDGRDALNGLDARVGDGDAGDTFASAAACIEGLLDSLPLADPSQLLASLSTALGHSAGGSSGILLAIFTGAASAEFRHSKSWPRALEYGAERMQFYGGAKLGDRTMLDALWPALKVLSEGGSLGQAARAAREGADGTAHLISAGAGRSAYLSASSLAGVSDPGAEAVALALEAMASL